MQNFTVYPNIHFEVSDSILSDSEDITITVNDTIPPAQPTVNPVSSPTTNSTQTITGTKSMDTAVLIMTSPQAIVGSMSYPSSTSWSCIVTLQEGNNDFVVFAQDQEGNQSSTVNFTVILDTTAPVFTITFPPDGSYIDKYGNAN